MIYEELLAIIKPPFDADPALLNSLEPALMGVCKHIRGEMLSFYRRYLRDMASELEEETIARVMPFQGYEDEHSDNATDGFWDAYDDLEEWLKVSVFGRHKRLGYAFYRLLIEMHPESKQQFKAELKALKELKWGDEWKPDSTDADDASV